MRANPVRTIVGAVVLLSAVAALLGSDWHDGRRLDALAALERSVQDADPLAPDLPEDRPLRLVGTATATGQAVDAELQVAVDALRLDRAVEMYQWRERIEGSGDRRSVHHEKVWSENLIDSTRFASGAPANPGSMPLSSLRSYAPGVRLGIFALDRAVLDVFPAGQRLPMPTEPRTVAGIRLLPDGSGWHSGPAGAPAVGDLRIRMSLVPAGRVTIVGGVRDGRIVPWSERGGAGVLLAASGDVPLAALAGKASRGHAATLWVRRLGFGIFVFFGLVLLWPAVLARLPVLAALGPAPFRGPLVASLGLVAAVLLAAHLLFRSPLVWP